MDFITGAKFQDLSYVSLSKEEHRQFESKSEFGTYIDIDTFNPNDYDNPYIVYANNSLINQTKQSLIDSDLYNKLKQFRNDFILILHNADQDFEERHIPFLEIEKCNHIYAQSVNIKHPKLTPIPMGIANSMWPHGNIDTLKKHTNTLPDIKTNLAYYNFSLEGEHRWHQRIKCREALCKNKFKWNETTSFGDYLNKLKDYKFCFSPPGNTLDCYRMWECLYLKVIPVCERNELTEYYSKLFPIVLVDDWNDITPKYLENIYEKEDINWNNYDLLQFSNLFEHLQIKPYKTYK